MRNERYTNILKVNNKSMGRTMKTLVILLLWSVNVSYGANSYAQSTLFSFDLKNSTLKELFSVIEKNSEFRFVYYDKLIDNKKKISIDANNLTIDKILDKAFASTDITYEVLGRQIIIVRKSFKVENALPQPSRERIVTGTVTDNFGAPMPGVTVLQMGTSHGTITDINGEFSISVPNDTTTLQFRMVGYQTYETKVGTRKVIAVSMIEETANLDEVVVVGFGKQKKTDLIGSVESVNIGELKKVSSSNITTMLAGNIAGIISYQRSGEPGADNADFFIRGVTTFGYKKDPLILIDGIEATSTDLARMQPDDIANFSIMKDATSTAVYGARGANGVIAITTKEGTEGKIKVSVRAENSFTSPTKQIELADPITYMELGNEAVLTRDPLGTLPYALNKIDNTKAGMNKYVYPAVDWQKEMFKKVAATQRVNLNISGGGKVARYYLAATFNQDNGNLKVDKRNNFNNNIRLRTYSVRSNVNFTLTRTTEAAVRVSGTFDDYIGPINGGTVVYNQVMHATPVLFPPYYAPDIANAATNHILFGNYGDGNYVNPYADMVKGYKDYSRSTVNAQFELKQDFSFLVKGLSVRALFNTSRYSYFDVSRYYNPFYYSVSTYDKLSNMYVLSPLNETTGTEYLNYNEGKKEVTSSTYIELMANFDCTFGKKHAISGMLVYNMRDELAGNAGSLQLSLPSRNLGLSGRATYSYDDRYYGEFNFGYNGSERFYKTQRFGFFPSIGAAWTISHEKFWKWKAVSNLKLRTTYGLVGNDAIGAPTDRFFYLSNVNMNATNRAAAFGTLYEYVRNGVYVSRNSNENITWEVARKLNVGFELGLFDDAFTIEADYFHERRSNILMTRASIPNTMGLSASEKANVGKAQSQGVDGAINFQKNFGHSFWMKARANFTFATSKYLAYEEPNYAEDYRKHVGYPLTQRWGYIAERLFVDDIEVANSPKQSFGTYGAGDIKYYDVNNDGQITTADMVPIGYPVDPEIIYGFGISSGYRNFDFSCFFQGSARSSFWIDPVATSPFAETWSGASSAYYKTQLLKAYADDHWSEDNRDLYALWPRLSPTVNNNNSQVSTWFMRNGSFLRLKSVEVGFTLPDKTLHALKLTNLRFYVIGTNLLCFSRFKLWDVEMGGNGLGYPIQKSISIGAMVSF